MPLARKVIIAALALLGGLLLVVFLFVYFSGDEGNTVELTAAESVGTGDPMQELLAAPLETGDTVATNATGAEEAGPIRVYVAGAVQKPDVYPMQDGDRLVDVVEAAGGATKEADLEQVNLAIRIKDEGYYFIPYQNPASPADAVEDEQQGNEAVSAIPALAADLATGELPSEPTSDVVDAGEIAGLVNLNTATQAQLESLPGIGPARAKAILAYREQNGPFQSIDEITAVSGIGQGIFDNLQSLITVGNSP